MNWSGCDPLLSTFVGWPEGDFVRLLFHELAHQVVYAQGDTVFNEWCTPRAIRCSTNRLPRR